MGPINAFSGIKVVQDNIFVGRCITETYDPIIDHPEATVDLGPEAKELLLENQELKQTLQKGVRFHNAFTSFFLRIFGKIENVKDDTGTVFHLNKSSYNKFKENVTKISESNKKIQEKVSQVQKALVQKKVEDNKETIKEIWGNLLQINQYSPETLSTNDSFRELYQVGDKLQRKAEVTSNELNAFLDSSRKIQEKVSQVQKALVQKKVEDNQETIQEIRGNLFQIKKYSPETLSTNDSFRELYQIGDKLQRKAEVTSNELNAFLDSSPAISQLYKTVFSDPKLKTQLLRDKINFYQERIVYYKQTIEESKELANDERKHVNSSNPFSTGYATRARSYDDNVQWYSGMVDQAEAKILELLRELEQLKRDQSKM